MFKLFFHPIDRSAFNRYTDPVVLIQLIKALPRFFIWVFAFLFGSLIYYADWFAYHLLGYHKRSEFVRMGGCARTGQCCRNLAIQMPRSWVRHPRIQKWITAWYRQIFNFHYVGTTNENWLVFECHYLKNGNTCSIYPFRPKLCREFPLVPLFGHGLLHKGCGFYFAKRSELGGFGEALVRQEHEQERGEYLQEQGRVRVGPSGPGRT